MTSGHSASAPAGPLGRLGCFGPALMHACTSGMHLWPLEELWTSRQAKRSSNVFLVGYRESIHAVSVLGRPSRSELYRLRSGCTGAARRQISWWPARGSHGGELEVLPYHSVLIPFRTRTILSKWKSTEVQTSPTIAPSAAKRSRRSSISAWLAISLLAYCCYEMTYRSGLPGTMKAQMWLDYYKILCNTCHLYTYTKQRKCATY